MKIQIVSDTHLEFRNNSFKNLIKPSAPILFLLGDICVCGTNDDWNTFKKFLTFLSPQFKYIFFVPGNHEYYTSSKNITNSETISGINLKIKKFIKTLGNVYALIDSAIKMTINEIKYVFIGTTLWSYIEPKNYKLINSSMNDYSSIWVQNDKIIDTDKKPNRFRHYNVHDMSKLHIKSVKFINRTLKKINTDETAILLTHHKPIRDEPITNKISQAYESDLKDIIIKHPLKLACWGHTHKKYDKIINNVKCVSNPKGYPHQNTMYKNDYTVDI